MNDNYKFAYEAVLKDLLCIMHMLEDAMVEDDFEATKKDILTWILVQNSKLLSSHKVAVMEIAQEYDDVEFVKNIFKNLREFKKAEKKHKSHKSKSETVTAALVTNEQ